jgi:hypothetical protein
MRVYVASSWRNAYQQDVVKHLREAGHEVYDFKHPKPDDEGFHWSEIDPNWRLWTPYAFRAALEHPLAQLGFAQDRLALEMADITVLVLPCGRSAHLELGYAVAQKQRTVVLMLEPDTPELMYKFCERICFSVEELLAFL